MKNLAQKIVGTIAGVCLVAGSAFAEEVKTFQYNKSCTAFYTVDPIKESYKISKLDCGEIVMRDSDDNGEIDRISYRNGDDIKKESLSQDEKETYELAFSMINESIRPRGNIYNKIMINELEEVMNELGAYSIPSEKPNLDEIGNW